METTQSADETIHALTAENVMDRNCLIIPRQMLVREAARLLNRKRSDVAAVVDENGRCAGMLRAADVFRWIDADCPHVVVGPGLTCPYLVRGRLLNGDEGLICILTHGSCGFQKEVPTTGGRHTDLCVRREATELPFGARPSYMMTDVVSVSSRAKLLEMVLQLVELKPMDFSCWMNSAAQPALFRLKISSKP
jgi:hypothetical protein